MAGYACAARSGRSMLDSWMAARAGAVVAGCNAADARMSRMTAQAGECSPALRKTTALAEVQRLMADIPGVIPIGIVARGRGLAMAGSARLVQLRCRKPFRISYCSRRALQTDVLRTWTMTGLALNPCLEWYDSHSFRELQWTGRMTLKAAQNSCPGIKRSVALARRSVVPRRK
jgi:hypothetical protein